MRGKVDWELIERIAGELGVTAHACAKWRQRNSIPHKWRLSIVLKSGGLVRWEDFVRLDRQRRGDDAMMYVGIDPGLSGAIAFFNPDKGLLMVRDMPVVEIMRNNKRKREVSPQMLAAVLREFPVDNVMIERVGAMPGQGVTSMFSLGRSLGIVEGVCAALELSTSIVPPTVWRKAVQAREGKDGTRSRAAELFPRDASLFARKKDDGRADAALIAWHCATR